MDSGSAASAGDGAAAAPSPGDGGRRPERRSRHRGAPAGLPRGVAAAAPARGAAAAAPPISQPAPPSPTATAQTVSEFEEEEADGFVLLPDGHRPPPLSPTGLFRRLPSIEQGLDVGSPASEMATSACLDTTEECADVFLPAAGPMSDARPAAVAVVSAAAAAQPRPSYAQVVAGTPPKGTTIGAAACASTATSTPSSTSPAVHPESPRRVHLAARSCEATTLRRIVVVDSAKIDRHIVHTLEVETEDMAGRQLPWRVNQRLSQLRALHDAVERLLGADDYHRLFRDAGGVKFPSMRTVFANLRREVETLNRWLEVLCGIVREGRVPLRLVFAHFEDVVIPVAAEAVAQRPQPPPGWIRVLAIRHGEGMHNKMGVLGAIAFRDAELTEAGADQARAAGRRLGLTEMDLLVVSPLTRALDTLTMLLDSIPESDGPLPPVVVQSLCAEKRFFGQNDSLGTPVSELARAYPAFCFRRGDPEGFPPGLSENWWERGGDADEAAGELSTLIPGPIRSHLVSNGWEDANSFGRRAVRFRQWLRRLPSRYSTVAVVSHGGLLCQAFGGEKYENLGNRVFDLRRVREEDRMPDASLSRPPEDADEPARAEDEWEAIKT